jgi:hypothetical protein
MKFIVKYLYFGESFPARCVFGIRQKKQPSHSRSGRVSGVLCAKIRDKIHIDSKAFGMLLERSKSAVFWLTGQYSGVFSTRTEKEGFTGFYGIGRET